MVNKARGSSAKKGKKATSQAAPETLTGPILYADFIDSTEAAAILIQRLHAFMADSPEVAFQYADPDLDPVSFGNDLKLLVDSATLNEFMYTDLGRGLLLGLYLGKMEQQLLEEEAEANEG